MLLLNFVFYLINYLKNYTNSTYKTTKSFLLKKLTQVNLQIQLHKSNK